MRILLVTWSDQFLQKMLILNPQLEFCAIVVDEIEPAKKVLERVGLPTTILRPLYELKECIRDLYYDYIICTESFWDDHFLEIVQDYDAPKDKILAMNFIDGVNFIIERAMRYFAEHAAEFEMFATGMSYAESGLDVTQFNRKLFNFARSSQDLYYNFQTAKFAVNCPGNRLRYALIELAPYKFHYDLSQSVKLRFLMLHYLIAFDDLHNFHVPADVYKSFLREEYFTFKPKLDDFDVNNPFLVKKPLCFMTPESRFRFLKTRAKGEPKDFPKTREENIRILDDYLTLCEERNIRPIMFLAPMSEGHMKYFSRRRLDEFRYLVRQAQKKHPLAIFIDGWQLDGMTERDFYDYGHMNIQGAAKFSAYLNSIIEQL